MKDFYQKIYERIGNLTPIESDCGLLCQKACCKGDEDAGMYLYPGEEQIYRNGCDFGKVLPTDFTYSHNGAEQTVFMFACNGSCDREMRPLACRIFPFVPYVDNEGNIDIEIDRRGEGLCPLVKLADEVLFNEKFLDSVADAIGLATEDDRILAFMKAQSRLIDEYDEIL